MQPHNLCSRTLNISSRTLNISSRTLNINSPCVNIKITSRKKLLLFGRITFSGLYKNHKKKQKTDAIYSVFFSYINKYVTIAYDDISTRCFFIKSDMWACFHAHNS